MNIRSARFCRRFGAAIFIAAAISVSTPQTHAVILYGTDDPAANTTAPIGSVANSAWSYEGQWGGNLGTPIAPHFFITAKHVGGTVGEIFYFQGAAYQTTAEFGDASTDLRIWQVSGTFPYYAPLYMESNEVGQPLVVIGRGTQRGGEIELKRKPRGWGWGLGDGIQRWGENVVAAIVSGGTNNEYIYATFDEPPSRSRKSSSPSNEATLSSGDSGGGVFLKSGGIWKLAGINYAVDGPFYTSTSDTVGFLAALFDSRDFYYKDDAGKYVLIAGRSAIPSGFYSTRISSRLAWIFSVIQSPAAP